MSIKLGEPLLIQGMSGKEETMRYRDLISKVDEFEGESELGDHTYFEALKMLKDVQKDLTRLDDVQHMQRVIKPFLIQWGMMGVLV